MLEVNQSQSKYWLYFLPFVNIRKQIVVIAVAHVISHSIAYGVKCIFVIIVHQSLKPVVHFCQLIQRCMFLNNHKLVTAIACQKAVLCKYPCEKRRSL